MDAIAPRADRAVKRAVDPLLPLPAEARTVHRAAVAGSAVPPAAPPGALTTIPRSTGAGKKRASSQNAPTRGEGRRPERHSGQFREVLGRVRQSGLTTSPLFNGPGASGGNGPLPSFCKAGPPERRLAAPSAVIRTLKRAIHSVHGRHWNDIDRSFFTSDG